MKQILLMIAVVALVGCGGKEPTKTCYWCKEEIKVAALVCKHCGSKRPDGPLIKDPIVKEAIRQSLKKPTGELTEEELASVTELNLGKTKITDADLGDIAKLQKLTHLHLYDTKITDAGLGDIAKLQQLKFLSLWGTEITDAGLKELAKLQNLTNLDLQSTEITDAGLKDIAKMKNLWVLSLSYTHVTEAGVAELKKALPRKDCAIFHSHLAD